MKETCCKGLLILFLTILSTSFKPGSLMAQGLSEKEMMEIMDKAMGTVGADDENTAIYFEGIAFGIAKPEAIFKMPAYKVYRGGHLFNLGKKFEIKLGIMKALCDGKIMVIVDEKSKSMVIDSLRDEVPGFAGQKPDLQKLIDDNFGTGEIKYAGTETINGKKCHKIKAIMTEDKISTHVFYWVEIKSNKLLLMAEWQNNAYDVYWIKSIGQVPKGHVFDVKIPKRELEDFYGYQVFDLRYSSEMLKR
ncbi:hypothetical protein [Adhaeribacter soli]|uniref:Uncharacterized protein n=1 Tax=Adhaeribacter soli TaxID=2607655 RepID=A0A5N1IN55_9BACT|nr:hypothetical protein [Adhaeribacter soli]KAA9324910.1 hypothetical protein F0P94_19485 [Adhaeribacter soli]